MASGTAQDAQPIELTGPQAASFTGVSYRQFMNYLDGPFPPPRQGNKKFRSDDLGKWLRDKVTRELRVEIDEDPTKINAAHERARKDKESADKLSLENRVRRGELVEASEVKLGWMSIVMKVRTRLMGLPASIAPLIAVEDDPAICQSLLDDHVREALDELSGSATRDDDAD